MGRARKSIEEYEEMEHVLTHIELAVDELDLSVPVRKLFRSPEREVRSRLTVEMDDGETGVFPAYRVLWNSARGPGKGGLRFHPDETPGEIHKLAALMCFKTAVAGLPLGGAKGGVRCDVKSLSDREKERLCRQYLREFYPVLGPREDVPAPDVYVTSRMISWMLDEYETINGSREPGAITGKPIELGGSKLRDEATALGGVFVVREVAEQLGIKLAGRTVAIQGFGNVGANFHRLAEQLLDLKVTAVSDSSGAVFDPGGLCYEKVSELKQSNGTVASHPTAEQLNNGELLELDVDILVPAALGDVITGENASELQCDLIVELANGPTTRPADRIFSREDVIILPDMLANAGGVTVSYFEQVQNSNNYYWTEKEVRSRLDQKMSEAVDAVLEVRDRHGVSVRRAAYLLAVGRVHEAMRLRGEV